MRVQFLAMVFLAAAVSAPAEAAEPQPPWIWSYWCHEPADHLRRMGSTPSVFTLGEWMPQWYARMHGEELIAKAADCGVNIVYAHFFKSFGLEHERDEMERTRGFTEVAHRHGVKVLGYCTMGSIYYETLKDEVPDIEDWAARDIDGRPIEYGGVAGQYFRWRPCIANRKYIEYLKKVISYGAEHVGLDGFHFDNSGVIPCYCERCQRAFREWLAENVKDPRGICGLAHFRNVRIPPASPEGGGARAESHDPLVLWRDRFRKEQHARAFAEVFAHVRGHGKLIIHNSGLAREGFPGIGSYSPAAYSADFMFIENPNTVRVENGRAYTQIVGYKIGRRYGFKVFDATWYRHGKEIYIPRDADTLNRIFTQGMIYGDICGAAWMPRSVKTGDRVVMDEPAFEAAMRGAFGYFRRNAALYDGNPVARTHLLFSTDSCYDGTLRGGAMGAFLAAGDLLNESAVPFVLADDGDIAGLPPGDLLVIPAMRFTRLRQHEAIAAAAKRGVRVLLLGDYGLFDENGVERDLANPVRGLADIPGLLRELPDDAKVSVPKGVMVETSVNSAGEFVFHLFRPGNGTTLGEASVELRDPHLRAGMSAELFSVEGDCALAEARTDDGRATLRVRGLRTMASIRFR